MGEMIENVNWLAVVAGAVISFALGWLWYSPILFGKPWMEGQGITIDAKPPPAAMIVQAIGTFLLAWVVGITASNDALLTIILMIITILFLMASAGLYSKKKPKVIIIELGYVVAMSVVMIICQGAL